MLCRFAVSSYRSLREAVIRLERLNLVTGPNGSGKSNLYRALRKTFGETKLTTTDDRVQAGWAMPAR